MREIKFRGLEIEHTYMVFGSLISYDPVPEIQETTLGEMDYDYPTYEVVSESVGQYTGLKDKNGFEIYEGDILKTEQGIASVIWFDAAFALKSPGSEAIDFEHSSVYEMSEIIGNIHENPDLLTQHKN